MDLTLNLLKQLSSSICKTLVKFFNKSLEPIKCLPFLRKQANVTPIFKGKGSEDVIHNYRPISLTSAICKIMVKIILNTYNFNLENNILIKYKSGFKPNDSTVNQLLEIYNTIISNLDKGKDVRFIFLWYFKGLWQSMTQRSHF